MIKVISQEKIQLMDFPVASCLKKKKKEREKKTVLPEMEGGQIRGAGMENVFKRVRNDTSKKN